MEFLGVVREAGRVFITDADHCRHLHNEDVGACFGEWIISEVRQGGGGVPSTPVYELVLMPEEAVYLAHVIGCLSVVTITVDESACSSETKLAKLLRLVVIADSDGSTFDATITRNDEDGSTRDGASVISMPPVLERAAFTRVLVYAHFRRQGLVVKDGVLLGCHFLLYRDSPGEVHSDYGVWVIGAEFGQHAVLPCGETEDPRDCHPPGTTANSPPPRESWLHVNMLSRLLQDVSKRLVLCSLELVPTPRVVEVSFS
mmetsp:Transcript_77724/g.152133  ORF Transcript_77724/g.152133 Transcript_77724/m.152133 type:complete len:258 (-) Transcript_77724:97-870(-)